jgi:transposase-like protein
MPVTADGLTYPGDYAELRSWFRTEAACLDYLDLLRWPEGFVCPHCAATGSWKLPDGRHKCHGCRRRVSATAGTVLHATRTPLTLWFAAAWEMTTRKNGVSALYIQQTLGIGSYQTAWAMLHRFRSVMVMPGRELLRGEVEVDETFVGGPRAGKRGRGATNKTMVIVAVERRNPRGFGRCRLGVIPNAQSATLKTWLEANIEARSVLVTDGLTSYPSAAAGSFTHEPFNVKGSGQQAHIPLPGVHRVSSLFKRWLLGTTQGAIDADHLQSYLNEFVFRFNRRNSRHRGLLFQRLLAQAVQGEPRTFKSLVASPAPHPVKAMPHVVRRVRPESLDLHVPEIYPWRG